MSKYLVIVESPNKVATLRQFLGNDYIVAASVGHITKIKDSGLYNMGIDVNNNFEEDIVVDDGKKEVVKNLKELIKNVDKVYLATDPDREGEAISYYLKNILKLSDSKYERITFHEITKTAVLNAINNPRKIDFNLANGARSRAAVDKIIGYRVSPVVLTKCGCKSAGRVQSAALKILAMREDEINNFVSETYNEIWLPFKKGRNIYRAQYKGTDKKKVVSISDIEKAKKIINECEEKDYIVKNIESKDRHISSKPPFTTSTFQQECSSRLGYSTTKSMECAQKLFEGINLNGNHVALITYIRTDSTDLNDEFVETLNDYVKNTYGKEYYAPVKKAKKAKNSQDGHEALHVIDLTMTPDKLKTYITDTQLLKVYKIIYERTVACAMSDCVMTDTEYSIYNGQHRFSFTKHKVKFSGFKAVYDYSDEEEDEKYPDLTLEEKVNAQELELVTKETTPPGRYTEASLIKKLEETGIGRPSTFASTLAKIQDKELDYTTREGKTIKVTEKGMRLSKFLDKAFGDIINLTYTSEMEADLDKISNGEMDRVEFLKEFYTKLCNEIVTAKKEESTKPKAEETGKVCPQCGKALVIRESKYGKFIACSGYPKCKYTEKIEDPNKPKADPATPKAKDEDTGYKCPTCSKAILKRTNPDGTVWYRCSGYPKHKKIFTVDEYKKIVAKQSVDSKSKDLN